MSPPASSDRSEHPAALGPPQLRPFGLVLHRDGDFTHEGQPIRNVKLRALFERSVAYLADEGKFVVRAGHFRGEIEVEEAAFFVRSIELDSGLISLSDRSDERFEGSTLGWSRLDPEVLTCRVKTGEVSGGLLARFTRGAQAELLLASESEGDSVFAVVGRRRVKIPDPIF